MDLSAVPELPILGRETDAVAVLSGMARCPVAVCDNGRRVMLEAAVLSGTVLMREAVTSILGIEGAEEPVISGGTPPADTEVRMTGSRADESPVLAGIVR
jgi:hypothetical protein